MATADDVERVFKATSSCKTVDEIVKSTGLSSEVVDDCIKTLNELGVIAKDQVGRVCNYNAVRTMQEKFQSLCLRCE